MRQGASDVHSFHQVDKHKIDSNRKSYNLNHSTSDNILQHLPYWIHPTDTMYFCNVVIVFKPIWTHLRYSNCLLASMTADQPMQNLKQNGIKRCRPQTTVTIDPPNPEQASRHFNGYIYSCFKGWYFLLFHFSFVFLGDYLMTTHIFSIHNYVGLSILWWYKPCQRMTNYFVVNAIRYDIMVLYVFLATNMNFLYCILCCHEKIIA